MTYSGALRALPMGRRGWFSYRNDCLRAAIATVVDVDYSEAPDTAPGGAQIDISRQLQIVGDWARTRDLVVSVHRTRPRREWAVACGRSGIYLGHTDANGEQFGEWVYPDDDFEGHAVVLWRGRVRHDPGWLGPITVPRNRFNFYLTFDAEYVDGQPLAEYLEERE